jgi:predicted CopG family antitoxin
MSIIESIKSKYTTWKAKRAVESVIELVSDLYDINIPKEVYPKIEVKRLKKYSFSDLLEIMIKRAKGEKVGEDFDIYNKVLVYDYSSGMMMVVRDVRKVYDTISRYNVISNTIYLSEPYSKETIVEEATHYVRAYARGYIGQGVYLDEVLISELLAEVTIQKIFNRSRENLIHGAEYKYAIKAGELWKKGVDVFSELTSDVKPSDLIRMPAKEIKDKFISILNKHKA